ncbi:MAG: efflux RND transporter periplasmic adaptor subunit [candidate division Zixibacteria bacterium]|nr:efflux RND transporter periplasmic adaptor subunit [candidate division Zixibacteria bacterium]
MLKKTIGLAGLLVVTVVATIGVMKWLDQPDVSSLSDKSVSNASSAETASAAADWCAEHRVPESECAQCHPKLIEAFKAKNDWCAEHGLPESHCRLCHPNLTFPQEPPPASSLHLDMNSEISIFFPKNKAACATDGAIIQFASAQTAERAGLTVEPALSAETAPTVEAPAEIVFDETQTTILTTTVSVLVTRWLANPGDAVDEGEILAELESPDMPGLKAELLEARAAWSVREKEQKRMERLKEKNLISASGYETSQAAAEESRARLARAEGLLRSAGLTVQEVESVAAERSITSKFLLRAQNSGVFMERKASLGNLLPAGTALAVLSSGNSVWLEAQVREEELSRIKVGQKLEFLTDAAGTRTSQGKIAWVARFLDSETRTGKVRAKMTSSFSQLPPGRFGRAVIYTQSESRSVVVPKDAVQWEGCCNVVFVEEAPDRYRPRKVEIEPADPEHYRVAGGLKPGEPVVVKGSYLLKTELKKGSIGAGCCAVEPTS